MIKVENVYKEFIKNDKNNKNVKFYADNDISLTAKEGEIVGILGPNGAGKTTLLRMLAGILEPTKGNITIDDLSYKSSELEIKKRIAYLSGNTKLYNHLSPYELFMMCAEFYEVDKNKAKKKIKELSKELKMDNFLYNRLSKLSTGQMQRVNIARCMIHDPKIYILDEATSGLDIIASQIILDFIKKEKEKGKLIIYSTHYMEEAENICDNVIMINKGKIIKEGSPDKINSDLKTTNLRDAFFKLIKEDVSYE